MTSFFLVTFAFSTMEQTFSLLFQSKFHFETSKAGYFTGFILMTSGILGAFIQGGLMKKLSQRFTEKKLLQAGLLFNALGMLIFPFCPSYVLYFLAIIPLSIGSSLINPNVSALISKSVSASEQGRTLGITQGLGSLARALGPFCGLLTFDVHYAIPYLLASLTTLTLFIASISKIKS